MLAVKVFVFFMLAALSSAQIPSLGWCPDYQAMPNFNMNRFMGTWHEAERYFTITELGSRCVTTTYEKLPDGRVVVYNEIKSAITGVRRVLEGHLQHVGRDGEGKLAVKYTSLPVAYDTQYTILDTDYDTFAVMWSCNGIGPVHTQNAWVMTRERLAPGVVLQRAYGVLDKFKISRAFFVKTSQDDCTLLSPPIEAVDPTPAPVVATAAKSLAEEKKENDAEVPPVQVDEEEKVEVVPSAKSASPLPKVKSPLPVAELIISNVESKPVQEENAQPEQKEVVQLKSIPEPQIESKPVPAAEKEKVESVPVVKSIQEVPSKVAEEPELVAEPQQLKSENEIEKEIKVKHAEENIGAS